MPSETAVDAIRRKGWAQRDDREDGMVAADDARQAAADAVREKGLKKLKREQGVPELQNQADMDKAKEVSDAVPRRRRSPLYETRGKSDRED